MLGPVCEDGLDSESQLAITHEVSCSPWHMLVDNVGNTIPLELEAPSVSGVIIVS